VFRRRLWWLSLLVPAILAGSLGAMPEDPAPATKPAPVRDRMCAGCHSGVTIAGSSHGVLSKTIPDGACEACHGSAAAHIEDPWKNPLNKGETAVRGAARCLACHQTGPDHVTAWVKSEFAREGKTCTDCHSVHVESDRHLKHAPDGKGFLGDASCRVCHSPVVTAFAETAHAGVLGQPGGGCEACHGAGKAHVTAIHAGTGETGIAKAPERKACLLCHASVPTTHARRSCAWPSACAGRGSVTGRSSGKPPCQARPGSCRRATRSMSWS